MDPIIAVIAAVSAYLIGSISFSRLVMKIAAPDVNINEIKVPSSSGEGFTEMRTIGANTASIVLGPRVGCLIGWMDILKVTIPTLVFRLLYPDQPYFLIAAIFGMVGHNWPVYYRFKGGGGISALYGGFIVVDWLGALVCALAGLFFGLVVVKEVLVAFMAGAWFMIPWFWIRTQDPVYIAYAVIVNVLLILALIPEVRRAMQRRREGTKVDMKASLQVIPMGRQMLKIMDFFDFRKDKQTD
jgi:glycerol-3-phosphate acyltransferase PlsY